VRELQEHVRRPAAHAPPPQARRVEPHALRGRAREERARRRDGRGQHAVRHEVRRVLKRVVREHRPALRALEREERARRRRRALERDEPLHDREQPPDAAERARVADERRELAEPAGRGARACFGQPGAVLQPRAKVQEWDHELGGVLDELSARHVSVECTTAASRLAMRNLLDRDAQHGEGVDTMRRAHSLPLHVLRYRRRWSSVGEGLTRENAPSTASFR
jgi:hypothetical protein